MVGMINFDLIHLQVKQESADCDLIKGRVGSPSTHRAISPLKQSCGPPNWWARPLSTNIPCHRYAELNDFRRRPKSILHF